MSDLNKEILKYVIDQLGEKDSSKIAVQKVIFFLREIGIPITYTFGPYAYGPYSKELNNDADELIFWEELVSYNNGYKKGEKFSINLPKWLRDSISEKIEEIRSVIEDFSFDSLELFGTVFYCIRSLQEIYINPSFEKVQEEFKAWKGNKYLSNRIQQAYKKIMASMLVVHGHVRETKPNFRLKEITEVKLIGSK